jgi:uncharacterized membrane protein (UPF0127 family)
MKRWSSTLALAAVVLVFVGCQPAGNSAPGDTAVTPAPRQYHLNEAQPKLPTLKLWLGSQEIAAEVARRTTEIATGMMFRTNLADSEGMLFVFAQPFRASFYMRNTRVPLTAAYLAPDGTILELHELKPFDETPASAASDKIQFVLEMPQGWFQRHQVSTGAVVRTPYGGLADVNWTTLQPRAPRTP